MASPSSQASIPETIVHDTGDKRFAHNGSSKGDIDDDSITHQEGRDDSVSSAYDEHIDQRKRKRDEESSPPPRARPHKLHCNELYRQLYNFEAPEAAERFASSGHDSMETSQLGSCVWSSDEKEVFFNALAKLGKDDIHGISAAVVTKSELEVRDYILLLQHHIQELKDTGASQQLTGLLDIPAAHELGEECCEQLEKMGDDLVMLEEQQEQNLEKQKFGPYWRVDIETAGELEACIAQEIETSGQGNEADRDGEISNAKSDKIHQTEILDAVPCARLLHVSQWLELSEAVFMQPFYALSAEENDLSSNAATVLRPSLLRTALEEFHTIAIKITTRIVHATIFQVLSRLRSVDIENQRPPQPVIKKRDVLVALEILKMQKDSTQFWNRVVQNYSVDEGEVKEAPPFRPTSENNGRRPSNDQRLSVSPTSMSGANAVREQDMRHGQIAPAGVPSAEIGSSSESDVDSSEAEDSEDSSLNEKYDHSSQESMSSENEQEKSSGEAEEHEHCENWDQQTSQREEIRMWEILGQPRATPMKPNTKSSDPQQEPVARRTRDSREWRDDFEYEAEWESDPFRYAERGAVMHTSFMDSLPGRSHGIHSTESSRQGTPTGRGNQRGVSSARSSDASNDQERALGRASQRSHKTQRRHTSEDTSSSDDLGDSIMETSEPTELPQRMTLPRRASETARALTALLPEMPTGDISSSDDYYPG